MAEKTKVNKVLEKSLKVSVFVPQLLLFPDFLVRPEIRTILFLSICSVYWFLIFMAPNCFVRYLIRRYDIGRVVTDIFSVWATLGMWGISCYLWLDVLRGINFHLWRPSVAFSSGLFVFPFVSLLVVLGGMVAVVAIWRILAFIRAKLFAEKDAEKAGA